VWAGDANWGFLTIVALWLTGFFVLYFAALNTIYLMFIIFGIFGLRRYAHDVSVASNYTLFRSSLLRPVSIIVPAYNEERNILETVNSLLLMHYPRFEVIVVNDGSTDDTLEKLKEQFRLVERHKVYRRRLPSKPVRALYESRIHPELVVVDKENGGKSDALNCGINVSTYPYYCGIDGDGILDDEALLKMMRPFLDEPEALVAAGGIVRVANNCIVQRGRVIDVRLPKRLLEIIQVVEYLQAFLSSRVAFSALNSVLLISGAFGMFQKEAAIEAGGYRTDTIGEDMELVVRMQRLRHSRGQRFRMVFVPDPVCWTEVPSDLKSLANQRRRWQKGLIDSLRYNRGMMLNPRYGVVGLFAMPYYFLFELCGPLVELFGYAMMIVFLVVGVLSWYWVALFFLVSMGFGMVITAGAILLEELSFHRYPRPLHVLGLLLGGLAYNLGYRQLNALWRLSATFEYVGGYRLWGRIRRLGFRTTERKPAAA